MYEDGPSGQILFSDAARQYVLRSALMSHYRSQHRHYEERIEQHLRPLWREVERSFAGNRPRYIVEMESAAEYMGDVRWKQRIPELVNQLVVALLVYQERTDKFWGGPELVRTLGNALIGEEVSWRDAGGGDVAHPAPAPSAFRPLVLASSYHTSFKDQPDAARIEAGEELARYVRAVRDLAEERHVGLTEFGGAADWAADFIHGDATAQHGSSGEPIRPYDPVPPFNPWQIPATVWLSLSSMFAAVGPTEPEDPYAIGDTSWHTFWVGDEGVDWDAVTGQAHSILDKKLGEIRHRFAGVNVPRYSKSLQRQLKEDIPLLFDALTKGRRYSGAKADRLRRLADAIVVDYPSAEATYRRRMRQHARNNQRRLSEFRGRTQNPSV